MIFWLVYSQFQTCPFPRAFLSRSIEFLYEPFGPTVGRLQQFKIKKDKCPTIAGGNGIDWGINCNNKSCFAAVRSTGTPTYNGSFLFPSEKLILFYFILFYISPLQEPTTRASVRQIRSSFSAAAFFILLDTSLLGNVLLARHEWDRNAWRTPKNVCVTG